MTQTDAAAVAAAKSALAIDYGSGDSSAGVTKNLGLATAGADGVTIAWDSSKPAQISNGGLVTRPSSGGDASVVLTATLSKNLASDTKVFSPITVLETDTGAIADAKAALVIGYGSEDSATSVTKDVTLPTTGANGVTISWSSSDSLVISTAGLVTRPDGIVDYSVTLTATISRGSASPDQRQFTLTVKITDLGAANTDAAALSAASAFTFGGTDSLTSVTQSFGLLAAGANGTTIDWASSDSGVIDPTTTPGSGIVHRPDLSDATVTLTATFSKGGVSSSTKPSYQLKVIKSPVNAADKVAADKAELAISFGSGDSAARVTQNLGLGSLGSSGSSITWSSNSAAYVANDGSVTRPAAGSADVTVILTATIAYGGASDTKAFPLTVKALPRTKLSYLDGASWKAYPDPALTAVSVAQLGQIPYAATSGGDLYCYRCGLAQALDTIPRRPAVHLELWRKPLRPHERPKAALPGRRGLEALLGPGALRVDLHRGIRPGPLRPGRIVDSQSRRGDLAFHLLSRKYDLDSPAGRRIVRLAGQWGYSPLRRRMGRQAAHPGPRRLRPARRRLFDDLIRALVSIGL